VWQEFVGKDAVYEWRLPLKVRTADNRFTTQTFLFDSGSGFTTFSIGEAEQLGIPYHRHRPVAIRGTTGTGHGFLAPMRFCLAPLPEYEFECLCCFSPTPLPWPLLSIKDVLDHFRLRTLLPSRMHPLGSLILQLHGRHKGQPRSP
jgi:hypothetical protein